MLLHFPESSLSDSVLGLPVIHKGLKLILARTKVSQFLIEKTAIHEAKITVSFQPLTTNVYIETFFVIFELIRP